MHALSGLSNVDSLSARFARMKKLFVVIFDRAIRAWDCKGFPFDARDCKGGLRKPRFAAACIVQKNYRNSAMQKFLYAARIVHTALLP
jgi:hypothetical protein